MKFNYEKFRAETNKSGTYSDWSESLVRTLEKAGDAHPTYDYKAHIFTIYIAREPTKTGRHRAGVSVSVICPDDGEIKIEVSKKLKAEEIPAAVQGAVKFISVMEKAGYILDV